MDALTDIAYYLGLFIVIFAGYAWMVFHNNKEERERNGAKQEAERVKEEEQKARYEEASKPKAD